MIPDRLQRLARRVRRRVERAVYQTGSRVKCQFCGWTGWRFMPGGLRQDPNRVCPQCGSLERYRMLPLVIARELPPGPLRILEIAPKPCFTDYCKRQPGWRYVSSDLDSPLAMVHADLRAMPLATDAFDAIVCCHVMEHIHDDIPAFRELARMLAPTGVGIICVPLRGAVTQEGAPRSEWLRLYGQDDHVRYYGDDIVDRMRAGGLAVERIDTLSYFSAEELDRNALRGDDRFLFLVRKAHA